MTESRRDGGGPIVAVVLIALALLAMLLTGCAVGPDYKRPDVDLPKDYGVAQAPTPAAERWWSVFGDPTLERLIDEALAANRDLRAAAERVEQSRAQLMVARAALWPDAGVQGERSRKRSSQDSAIPLPAGVSAVSDTNRLVLAFSWELDFWGKYRRATEAARAEIVASEAGPGARRAAPPSAVAHRHLRVEAR